MGVNVINDTSSQDIRMPAAAAISSGDLIINTESGKASVASAGLTISQNNNTTAGPSALWANNALSSYTSSSGQNPTSPNIVQLSTGGIALALRGDQSSSSSSTLKIFFRNQLGGVPYFNVTVSSATIDNQIIRSMGSVGFVVAWVESSTTLKFAIYSNTGTAIKAATTVSTVASSNLRYFNVNVLTNNYVVISYNRGGTLYFIIYDTAGNVSVAETTVEASSATNISVRPLSSGGFVIYYYTTAAKFGRYNSSGVLQGSLTAISGSSSLFDFADQTQTCLELTNGNLLFLFLDSSNWPQFAIYNSSGSSVKTATDVLGSTVTRNTGYVSNSQFPGVCVTSSGFTIFTKGTSQWYYASFNSAGSNLIGFATAGGGISESSTNTAVNTLQAFDLGNAGFAVYTKTYNTTCCGVNYSSSLFCSSLTGVLIGNRVNFQTASSTVIQNQYGILTSDGSFFGNYWHSGGSGQLYVQSYAVQRKSVIGVARNSVSAGGTVRVSTVGTFTLNSSYGAGGTFDQRSATVPGTKGTVLGTSAVLFGLSS